MNIHRGMRNGPMWLHGAAWALVWLAGSVAYGQQPGDELAAYKASGQGRSRASDASGIYNEFIAAQVSSGGRYNFGGFPGGASNVASSQSFNLSYSWPGSPSTSYTTVRVDGTDLVFGDSLLPVDGIANEGDVSTATATNVDLQLEVTQRLQVVNGLNSGRPDTIEISYQLHNFGSNPLNVGLRIMIDTMLNGNDAAPFRVPGIGAITTERMFDGAEVPTFWQAFQDLADPTIAAQGTLIGGDAVTPTRFALANWGRIQGSVYDFTADPERQTGDSGIGIWWDDMIVAPGSATTVVTYYGLGDQSIAQGNVLLGVSAPAEIDLSSPTFEVVANVQNTSDTTQADVQVELTVPAGFTEAPANARSIQSVGDLAPGQGASVIFHASAAGVQPGTYNLGVTAGASGDPNPTSLTRPITVTGDRPQAGPVDPAASHFLISPDSPVDPATGLAPLGVPLNLVAELLDAEGRPVPDVAPSHVTYTVTPTDAAQITPSVDASDATGSIIAVLIGLLRGTATITAQFDGTTFGSPVELKFDTVINAVATFDLAAGMHLLTQPIITTTAGVVGGSAGRGLLSPVYYDAVERRYVVGDGLPNGGFGRGFFIRTSAPLTLEAAGLLPAFLAPDVPVGQTVELRTAGADEPLNPPLDMRQAEPSADLLSNLVLKGEWNLLGNPFGRPMTWNLADFEVWVNGQRAGTLADPQTWVFVDPYAFVYFRDGYHLVFDRAIAGFEDVAHRIPLLAGFWVRRVASNNEVALRYAPLTTTPTPTRTDNGGGWTVGLTATAGDSSSSVTMGTAPGLGRSLSIQGPPAAGEPEVDLALLDGATRLAGQVLNRAVGELSYTAEVTGRAGREVTLTWQGLGRDLPAGYQATLIDLQSGRRVSMRTHAVYSYLSQGETRRLAIAIGRRSNAPLAVQVQAAPTRSRGASVALVLNQPATVHLRVTSLSGRLVREISRQSAGAGTTTLTWDGLDQSGRRVPAGLYQIVAIAESDEGELARATTTVNVE